MFDQVVFLQAMHVLTRLEPLRRWLLLEDPSPGAGDQELLQQCEESPAALLGERLIGGSIRFNHPHHLLAVQLPGRRRSHAREVSADADVESEQEEQRPEHDSENGRQQAAKGAQLIEVVLRHRHDHTDDQIEETANAHDVCLPARLPAYPSGVAATSGYGRVASWLPYRGGNEGVLVGVVALTALGVDHH